MGKPKMMGYFKPYTPNNKAKVRFKKKSRKKMEVKINEKTYLR